MRKFSLVIAVVQSAASSVHLSRPASRTSSCPWSLGAMVATGGPAFQGSSTSSTRGSRDGMVPPRGLITCGISFHAACTHRIRLELEHPRDPTVLGCSWHGPIGLSRPDKASELCEVTRTAVSSVPRSRSPFRNVAGPTMHSPELGIVLVGNIFIARATPQSVNEGLAWGKCAADRLYFSVDQRSLINPSVLGVGACGAD